MPRIAAPIPGIDDIREYIKSNVQVSRDALVSRFRLSDSDYLRLSKVLRDDKRFDTVGGRGGGGFRYVQGARLANDTDVHGTINRLLSDEDERLAAHRITEIFDVKQLREILSQRLVNALRSYKRHEFGKDTEPTKAEVAAALVIEKGTELFRDKKIRDLVAKRLSIQPIEKWHAGHRSAVHFVKQVGSPDIFRGEMNSERAPVLKFLPEKRRYPALEAFQRNARNKLLGVIQEQGSRVLLQLPTGSGKTRVAVDTMREFLTGDYKDDDRRGYAIIWCAHQDELCDQAAQTIEEAWLNAEEACPLNLIRYYGNAQPEALQSAAEDEEIGTPTILVTTPMKALKLLEMKHTQNELITGLQQRTRLLVIDEAHRAAAPTYGSILDALPTLTSVIGLTATPYGKVYLGQSTTDELLAIFNDKLIRPESLFEDFEDDEDSNAKLFLLRKNILAKPVVHEIRTGSKLSDPCLVINDEQDLEAQADSLDQAIRRDLATAPSRTQLIYRHLRPLFDQEGASILYFAPTVEDAFVMTFLLRVAGVAAECVHASTPDGLRRRYVKHFKEGRLKVLCNVEILTTGFDAPRVTHVVVARPTVSRVLYEQIVGRGLRGPKFGGTAECAIIDCVDSIPAGKLKLGYEYFREDWGITEVQGFGTSE